MKANRLMLAVAARFVPGQSNAQTNSVSAAGPGAELLPDAINYFLSKIIPGLFGFLSVLVFVRLVGVEQYGRYAVVFAFVMASGSGLAAWLTQGILRFQSQWHSPVEANEFRHAATRGMILSVVIGAVALAIAIPALGIQKGWSVCLSMVLFGVLLPYTVLLSRQQASLRSIQVLRFEAIRSVGGFLIPVALVWAAGSRNHRFLLGGIALGYGLPFLGLIANRVKAGLPIYDMGVRHLGPRERQILRGMLNFGWPVALWMLCQQGMLVSDRFFLQKFAGYSAAGAYASMYDVIVRSFSLSFMPITLAIHPLVMNRWNRGFRQQALRTIRSGIKYQFLLAIPVVGSLVLFAPLVCRLILGGASEGAKSIVAPLAIGGFLWQVSLLAHKPLEILCQTRRMLGGMLVAIAVNVAGNWLLVPRFGYRSSAYLTVASSAVYLFMLLVLTPKEEFSESTDQAQKTAVMDAPSLHCAAPEDFSTPCP